MTNGMNFTQLCAAVVTETNRADLITQIQQAVFASTLKMHGIDFFDKDILTAHAVFDTPAYIQVLDTTSLPRWRRGAFFRKDYPSTYNAWEATPTNLPPLFNDFRAGLVSSQVARALLEFIDPDEIFDDYGTERNDIAYQAGTSIFIRSSTSLQFLNLGWYAWPECDISNVGVNYSSWIAGEFPYAIVYDAASAILQKTGQTDAARKYDAVPDPRQNFGGGLVYSQIDNLLKSNISNLGS